MHLLEIDKENYLVIKVHDNNGYPYAPFYNPDLRDNNYVFTLTHSVDSKVQIENRYRIIRETIAKLTA